MTKTWRCACGNVRLKCSCNFRLSDLLEFAEQTTYPLPWWVIPTIKKYLEVEKERDQLKGAVQFEKERADGLAEELTEVENILLRVEGKLSGILDYIKS